MSNIWILNCFCLLLCALAKPLTVWEVELCAFVREQALKLQAAGPSMVINSIAERDGDTDSRSSDSGNEATTGASTSRGSFKGKASIPAKATGAGAPTISTLKPLDKPRSTQISFSASPARSSITPSAGASLATSIAGSTVAADDITSDPIPAITRDSLLKNHRHLVPPSFSSAGMLSKLWDDDLSSIGDLDDYISSDEEIDAKKISRHENENENIIAAVTSTPSQQPAPPQPEFIG